MINKDSTFIKNYINNFSKIIKYDENVQKELLKILKILKKFKYKNKVHIFGNGGSAPISNHFSMDLTNNSSIRCLSYNDPAIITCYANDFKFENWISRTIKKYGEKGDLLILISSSGESLNMIKAVKSAKQKKFRNVIAFTGFKKNNSLSKISDINFWIDSKNFNSIESAHHFFLLMIVDLIKLKKI